MEKSQGGRVEMVEWLNEGARMQLKGWYQVVRLAKVDLRRLVE